MLAALVLASARRPRTLTGVAAGLCLAMAVLTEHRVALVVPAVGWLLWRSSPVPVGAGSAWPRPRRPTARVARGDRPGRGSARGGRVTRPARPDPLVAGDASSAVGTVADGFDGRSVADLIGLDRIGAGACLVAAIVAVVCLAFARSAVPSGRLPPLVLVSGEPSWTIVVAMVPLGAVLLAAGAQLVGLAPRSPPRTQPAHAPRLGG